MNKLKSARVYVVVLALAIVCLTPLSCGKTTTERLQEAAEQPTLTAAAAESTPVPTSEVEPTATPIPSPTATPTPAPTPKPEAIQLVAQGFGQDDRDLGFAFLVENPNVGFAIERSQYQVAAYDDAGTVLKTDSGYIKLIVASQTL